MFKLRRGLYHVYLVTFIGYQMCIDLFFFFTGQIWPNLVTYLKCEMKVWEVGILSSLKYIFFKVYVGNLVNFKNFLLIYLFEGELIPM